MKRAVVALAATVTSVAACGQSSPSADDDIATTFDTIRGVVHVTNTGASAALQLTPVVSIGPRTLTGPESPEDFGSVNSVALGPDETVFVADAMNLEVRVFGLDGIHRRTFGRSGEGPGEFSSLYSLAWVGDRLLALDPSAGRISEFSAEGELLGSLRIQGSVFGSPTTVRFYSVGPNKTYRHALANRREGPVFVTRAGDGTLFVGHDNRGETGDTLRWITGPPVPRSTIFCQSEDGMSLFPIPFVAEFLQHPGPGGVLYAAMTDVYRVSVIRGEADTVRVIHRSLPPEPVTDAEWAGGMKDFEAFSQERPSTSCDPARPNRPKTKPFIRDMHVAPDGKLWVEVMRTAGNRWEVFDVAGELLGSVLAPQRKEGVAPAFGPESLVTIRQDSLNVEHINVWRLR